MKCNTIQLTVESSRLKKIESLPQSVCAWSVNSRVTKHSHCFASERMTWCCDDTNWQGANKLLCTTTPVFGESLATSKIAKKKTLKCSLRPATNAMFSKFRGNIHAFCGSINYFGAKRSENRFAYFCLVCFNVAEALFAKETRPFVSQSIIAGLHIYTVYCRQLQNTATHCERVTPREWACVWCVLLLKDTYNRQILYIYRNAQVRVPTMMFSMAIFLLFSLYMKPSVVSSPVFVIVSYSTE